MFRRFACVLLIHFSSIGSALASDPYSYNFDINRFDCSSGVDLFFREVSQKIETEYASALSHSKKLKEAKQSYLDKKNNGSYISNDELCRLQSSGVALYKMSTRMEDFAHSTEKNAKALGQKCGADKLINFASTLKNFQFHVVSEFAFATTVMEIKCEK